VQFLRHFHLTISNMWSNQYSFSCYRKPTNFAYNCPYFHSHSTNISRIANLNAWGDIAVRAARSTYWSCHDTIRTQILNCSQSWWNCKVEIAGRFQPGRKTAGLWPVPVTTPPRQSWLRFWPVLQLNRMKPLARNRTADRLPIPIAYTMYGNSSSCPRNITKATRDLFSRM
jgi:hypothetical protein